MSGITKRSVTICGRKTSVTLEDPFWDALRLIAKKRDLAVYALVQEIYDASTTANFSSSIRVYVLNHFLGRLG